MKYRVIEIDNKFYPQHRFLFFFWQYFAKSKTSYAKQWFSSLEEAKKELDIFIKENNQKVTIHNYP